MIVKSECERDETAFISVEPVVRHEEPAARAANAASGAPSPTDASRLESLSKAQLVSKVQELVRVYRALADRCDYALHLGLTEAGMGSKGIVSSTAGIGILLQDGIGDTIRVSLTPEPGSSRTQEVRIAQQILQSMDIRPFLPQVTACPGCGRTTSSYFQVLSQEVEQFLVARMPAWKKDKPQAANLQVAVMGCVVNGPGESKAAHIGISLPGTGEAPRAPVYEDGEQVCTLEGPTLAKDFLERIEAYVARMS